PDATAVRGVDTSQALQQGALTTAVAPRDSKELASAYLQRDVRECAKAFGAGLAEGMKRTLLERVSTLIRHVERLADGARNDCRHALSVQFTHARSLAWAVAHEPHEEMWIARVG